MNEHEGSPTLDRERVGQVLTEVWRDVLGVAAVGMDDDFFRSGGDSLRAGRLVARMRSRLNVELTIGDVFETPTPAGLITRTCAAPRAQASRTHRRSPVPEGARVRPSLRQEQLLRLMEQAPQMGRSRPLPMSFITDGAPSLLGLRDALNRIVERHDVLRSSFELAAGEWSVQVLPARTCSVPFSVVDAHDWTEERLLDDMRDRSYAAAPASDRVGIRVVYYRRDDEDRLLLVANHLVADGFSIPILLRELAALRGPQESDLPPVELQYYQYAEAQRRAIRDGHQAVALEYWSRQMARHGPWPMATLPTLRGRTMDAPVEALTVQATLGNDSAMRFAEACRRAGATPYSGYLAAACMALTNVGGPQGDEFGMNVISAGRSWPGTSGLIGFFSDYHTLGVGNIPRSFPIAVPWLQQRLVQMLRHDTIPRSEILSRFTEDGASTLPRQPCVLFDIALDPADLEASLPDGRLHGSVIVTPSKRVRRYPGLFLMVDGGKDVRLRCEFGAGECDANVIVELVEEWRGIVASAARAID